MEEKSIISEIKVINAEKVKKLIRHKEEIEISRREKKTQSKRVIRIEEEVISI